MFTSQEDKQKDDQEDKQKDSQAEHPSVEHPVETPPLDQPNQAEEIVVSGTCANCQQLKVERDEYKAWSQRAMADYQNLLRETTTRRGEWVALSEQQILEEFIPVYDNFKKAFAQAENGASAGETEKKWKNWQDGIGHIMKQFGTILKAHQVEEIKSVGEKFDPTRHETVGEEEAAGTEHGVILKEIDGGYMMGGRVIKAAKVVIAR